MKKKKKKLCVLDESKEAAMVILEVHMENRVHICM